MASGDDLTEEILGELSAELPPVPDPWLQRALAIGGVSGAPSEDSEAKLGETAVDLDRA